MFACFFGERSTMITDRAGSRSPEPPDPQESILPGCLVQVRFHKLVNAEPRFLTEENPEAQSPPIPNKDNHCLCLQAQTLKSSRVNQRYMKPVDSSLDQIPFACTRAKWSHVPLV